MSDQYLGEIRTFAFGVVPKGWVPCQGQILSISQNQALFSLLGTTYGGDGKSTFGLPNLQGRSPVSVGGNFQTGSQGGSASVTLTSGQNAAHTHTARGTSNPANVSGPASNLMLGQIPNERAYGNSTGNLTALASQTIGQTGGQPHSNLQPSLVVNACIALQGIYPTRP